MKKAFSRSGRRTHVTASSDTEARLVLPDRLINGRMLAWYALQQHDATGQFLSEILSAADSRHSLSAQERGLAVDVASGVMRRRRAIDTLLESQISRPRSNVEPDLWRLLQTGVYQIVYARTPDHASVDTTVELARAVGCSQWCGFANGVLRNVARLLTDEWADQPATDALPTDGGVYRRLNQSIFPDPATDLAEYIGRAFSLPRSLARRWSGCLSYHDLLSTSFRSLQVPPICLRVNRLMATVHQVQSALTECGVRVTPGHNDWSLRITHAAKVTNLPGYSEGWWCVQDESAMAAAEMLAPAPGERILDLCAAPGGKATQIAEISGDAATITACDVSEHRLRLVQDSIDRLQLHSIQPVLINRDLRDIPAGQYDAVLVDVPCSNTGVLSRRPEARWRFREDELEELVNLQMRLLLSAFEHVRAGGRIVYSTCSIEPEETIRQIAHITQLVPALALSQQDLHLPDESGDGAFQALLLKS